MLNSLLNRRKIGRLQSFPDTVFPFNIVRDPIFHFVLLLLLSFFPRSAPTPPHRPLAILSLLSKGGRDIGPSLLHAPGKLGGATQMKKSSLLGVFSLHLFLPVSLPSSFKQATNIAELSHFQTYPILFQQTEKVLFSFLCISYLPSSAKKGKKRLWKITIQIPKAKQLERREGSLFLQKENLWNADHTFIRPVPCLNFFLSLRGIKKFALYTTLDDDYAELKDVLMGAGAGGHGALGRPCFPSPGMEWGGGGVGGGRDHRPLPRLPVLPVEGGQRLDEVVVYMTAWRTCVGSAVVTKEA